MRNCKFRTYFLGLVVSGIAATAAHEARAEPADRNRFVQDEGAGEFVRSGAGPEWTSTAPGYEAQKLIEVFRDKTKGADDTSPIILVTNTKVGNVFVYVLWSKRVDVVWPDGTKAPPFVGAWK